MSTGRKTFEDYAATVATWGCELLHVDYGGRARLTVLRRDGSRWAGELSNLKKIETGHATDVTHDDDLIAKYAEKYASRADINRITLTYADPERANRLYLWVQFACGSWQWSRESHLAVGKGCGCPECYRDYRGAYFLRSPSGVVKFGVTSVPEAVDRRTAEHNRNRGENFIAVAVWEFADGEAMRAESLIERQLSEAGLDPLPGTLEFFHDVPYVEQTVRAVYGHYGNLRG